MDGAAEGGEGSLGRVIGAELGHRAGGHAPRDDVDDASVVLREHGGQGFGQSPSGGFGGQQSGGWDTQQTSAGFGAQQDDDCPF